MSALPVRILAIIGVVAAGGAFALWSGTGATEAEAETWPRTVSELPLDSGYYVRTDEDTCATATTALTTFLRPQGLYSDGGGFCTFHDIEQTGPTTFRVKHHCSSPREGPSPPTTVEWVIPDRTSFTFKDSEGWEHKAQLCSQQSLPAGFRLHLDEPIK